MSATVILVWLILGLVAGLIAKWLMPGRVPGGIAVTIVLGLVGAMVGGFLGSHLLGIDVSGFNITSIALAVGGAVIALLIYEALRRAKILR